MRARSRRVGWGSHRRPGRDLPDRVGLRTVRRCAGESALRAGRSRVASGVRAGIRRTGAGLECRPRRSSRARSALRRCSGPTGAWWDSAGGAVGIRRPRAFSAQAAPRRVAGLSGGGSSCPVRPGARRAGRLAGGHWCDAAGESHRTVGSHPRGQAMTAKGPRTVRVVPSGPLLVEGPVRIELADGTVVDSDRFMVAICTCRRSRDFPLCDTSHRRRCRDQVSARRSELSSDFQHPSK